MLAIFLAYHAQMEQVSGKQMFYNPRFIGYVTMYAVIIVLNLSLLPLLL